MRSGAWESGAARRDAERRGPCGLAETIHPDGTRRNLLLPLTCLDRLRMEHERLVVRLPKRQKDWLKQRATEFKTISDVVRDLIDREIQATSKTADADQQ